MSDPHIHVALLTPLYEATHSSKSGIARHYRYLADALTTAGNNVTVVHIPDFYTAPAGPPHPRDGKVDLRSVAVRLPRAITSPLGNRPHVRRLLHMLRSIVVARREIARLQPAPDVIETTSFGALGLLLAAGSPPAITRVSTTAEQLTASFEHFRSRASSLASRLERLAIKRSRFRLTHTRQHAAVIARSLNVPAASFAIVPHGIPELAPAAPPPDWPWSGPTIFFAGQFSERKGIDVVLAAAVRLLDENPDARLVVAGGPLDSEFAAPALPGLRTRFGPRFVLVPDPDDQALHAWMQACDLFTAPSRYESFGLIYLEAMRAGKAVVATRVGGIPEVVDDNATGLLVPAGDADALASAWLRCVADPAMLARFGEAGRRRFLENFTAAKMARESVNLYRTVRAHA